MTTMLAPTITQELVYADLSKLGDTGDQVAEALKELGIRGQRSCPSKCVLAEYLRWRFPHLTEVKVHVEHADLWTADRRFSVELPAACTQAENNFDGGRYPEIEIGGKQ